MSQMQSTKVGAAKEIDEYECSGTGPRPPVPGKESRTTKMMETGSSSSSNAAAASAQATFVVPNADDILAECARVKKWRDKLSNLLADDKGVELFKKFVESEAGPHGNYTIHLEFYFACDGLKQQTNPKTARKVIGAIYRNYLRRRDNEISVSTELLNTIRKIINSEREPDVNIYQEVQRGVEEKIALTTYPKFFQSRLYFDYSEQVQKRWEALNNNYSTGSSHVSSGSNYKQYGGEVSSGCVTLSPCDSLGASCSNLQESLTMNSVLPTLHEDTELTIHDDVSTKSLGGRSTKPKLTKESLLRTQSRRLVDVLANAHGYGLRFNESFNPVSRQDSERQSCSSASQTDSDTKSLVSSKDGQPYMHRKTSCSDTMKNCYMNPMIDANKTLVGPLTRDRLAASKQMQPREFYELLKMKLESLKEEQDKEERLHSVLNEAHNDEQQMCSKSFPSNVGPSGTHQANHQAFTSAILKKIQSIDADSDQAILDQHVSRVFSPHVQSPGTASPRQAATISRPPPPLPQRTNDPKTDLGVPPMRPRSDQISYSGSMSRKSDKNSAAPIYYDSGISMNSAEYKQATDKKPTKTEQAIEKTRSILEGAVQSQSQQQSRSRHHAMQSMYQSQSTSGGHQTNSLPRVRDHGDGYTYTVYNFYDEKVPYRTKMPSKEPTLKIFKEVIHKKGNHRYFFKRHCDEHQAVLEEYTSDTQILPLFEGKVMGVVMPM